MKTIRIMKFNTIVGGLFMFFAILSCEENEPGPSYKKIGTAYQTIASTSLSTNAPNPSGVVTITIKYVNVKSDPAKSIVVKYKEGSGAYTVSTTLEESGSQTGAEITKTYDFNVTQASGTTVGLQLEIFSSKEFPMVLQTSFKVK